MPHSFSDEVKRMKGFCLAFGLTVSLASATTLSLYDATLGGAPETQGWLAVVNLLGNLSTGAEGLTLDTTAFNNAYAGYSNYSFVIGAGPTVSPGSYVNASFPTLDRAVGFMVTVTMRINSQTNDGANGVNRAGISLTVLSNDHQGIEIGFRTTDIFSQSGPGFTVGESNASGGIAGLLSSLTTYDLVIQGNTYTLSTGGNTLLTGALRDYTAAVGFASDGYRAANFIAFGDNTTSARASTLLSNLSVTTTPEPGTAALGALGLAVAAWKRWWLFRKSPTSRLGPVARQDIIEKRDFHRS